MSPGSFSADGKTILGSYAPRVDVIPGLLLYTKQTNKQTNKQTAFATVDGTAGVSLQAVVTQPSEKMKLQLV